jgi:hypothetical protein
MILNRIQDFVRKEVEFKGSRATEFHFFITENDLLEVIGLCKQQQLDSQFNKEEKYYAIWYYNKLIKLRVLKDLEELIKLQKCVQDSLDLTSNIIVRRM